MANKQRTVEEIMASGVQEITDDQAASIRLIVASPIAGPGVSVANIQVLLESMPKQELSGALRRLGWID